MKDISPKIVQDTLICNEIYSADCSLKDLDTHDMPEVGIVTHGSGIHKIINRSVPCKSGDIFILNSGVPHKYFANNDEDAPKVLTLRFDPEEWFGGSESGMGCYGVFSESSIVAYAMLNSKTKAEVIELYKKTSIEIEEKKKEWQAAVRANLTLLLITVGRYINTAVKTDFQVKPKEWITVSSAITYIEENFGNPDMTLSTIAESLFLSQSYLSRIFKKLMGITFFEYVHKFRVEKSVEMLKNTKLSVDEISLKCGIKDVASFYNLFKKHMGISPKQFRKTENTAKTKGEIKMQSLKEISELVQKGRSKLIGAAVQTAIDSGADPEEILNEGLLDGMNIIGEKFKKNDVYVPEVLVAAKAMNMGMQILKPLLVQAGVSATGKVCIGTVQGDLHDIGKNLVKMMMEGKGLEVVDLGTDVAPATFVNTAIEQNCQVICCSALLTTTMDVMADVVKAAEAAGIRDKVKIMIGGAPVTEDYCNQIGADKYTSDAASAADAALELCK